MKGSLPVLSPLEVWKPFICLQRRGPVRQYPKKVKRRKEPQRCFKVQSAVRMGFVDPKDSECLSLCYKKRSGLNIDLDLYLPSFHKQYHSPRPVLVYFHGGGLTVGEKNSWFPAWLHSRVMGAGYAFISANYRLLPPATGHDIIEDIKDLFQFIRRNINDLIRAQGRMDGIDPQNIAVIGTSAGGLCAYLAGIHADPKPKAIISLYGMGGDFFTPHYLVPKVTPFFRGRELLEPESFSEYLYPNSVNLAPVSSSPLSYHGSDYVIPGYPSNPRMLLARLYLQLGIFLDYWTGEHKPSLSERLRAHIAGEGQQERAEWHSCVPPDHRSIFPQFNTSHFPPTFFIHGSKDTAVPAHESHSLCDALRSHGISAVVRICDGVEHSFDYEADAEQRWGPVFDDALQFLKDHLSSGPIMTFEGAQDLEI